MSRISLTLTESLHASLSKEPRLFKPKKQTRVFTRERNLPQDVQHKIASNIHFQRKIVILNRTGNVAARYSSQACLFHL